MIQGKLRFIASRPLCWAGTIPYSLYLIHQEIGYILINRLVYQSFNEIIAIIFSMVVVFLLSFLYWYSTLLSYNCCLFSKISSFMGFLYSSHSSLSGFVPKYTCTSPSSSAISDNSPNMRMLPALWIISQSSVCCRRFKQRKKDFTH